MGDPADSGVDATAQPGAREPSDPRPDPRRMAGMTDPQVLLSEAAARGEFVQVGRRSFVGVCVAGAVAGSLAACAGSGSKNAGGRVAQLPRGEWREPPGGPSLPVPDGSVPAGSPASSPSLPVPVASKPEPKDPPQPAREFNPVGEAALPWAKPRFLWAKAGPIRSQLNPMLPITCVTVHHDGLDELFWSTRTRDTADRIEHYRVGHLGRGWADIGYHLVIDRAGVLWQGRAIRWQGAHVQFHNEGNVGVLVMGNFDRQKPTVAQLTTLRRVLTDLRATYHIRRGEVYTHKEWKDAQTACPGRSLQPKVEQIRKVIGA